MDVKAAVRLANSNQGRRQKPKILSPINSFEGGVRVIDAGADEVYCGVTIPQIRDFVLYRGPVCEIPNYDELGKLIKYAHDRGVEVVVTVNQPFMAEMIEKPIRNHIRSCLDEGVDALIIGDMGVLSMVKDMGVDIPLYASTYAVSMNYEAVDFLGKLGFSRVILDRQVTVDEISEIVRRSKVEIVIFVHGGGCSNTNGNCHLYHFQFPAMNSAKLMVEGPLGSPCTLPFEIYDLGDGQRRLGAVPIMDALEFCSLCKLPELVKIGVAGFKIVGRCESILHQESATKIYRELIDVIDRGEMEAFQDKLEFLKKNFLPGPPNLHNLQEFYCDQKRCYYAPLLHAPYKVPLSWQAWTKSRFKLWEAR